MNISQSDYFVYVDESGSPELGNVDPDYPLFVLAFLIIKKVHYSSAISPAVQTFKFKHFGHEQIILHENEIRRDKGDFSHLKTMALKELFLNDLSNMVSTLPFSLVCVVIHKHDLKRQYSSPSNPYHLGLEFGLERVKAFLQQEGDWGQVATESAPVVNVIVEMRGRNEDNDLELEFKRICEGGNYQRSRLNFRMVFADKKSNSAGLQLADLIARPVGLSVLRPAQPNRAYEVILPKFIKRNGEFLGWGLKTFP